MTMSHKKFIGIFHSIDTVLYKLTEMKANGYEEDSIHVFSCEQDNISMLEGQTKMNLTGSYGENWRKGFNEFLGIEEPVFNAFNSMGFSDQEAQHYFDEVENGGIAMFVDTTFVEDMGVGDSSVEINQSGKVLDGQGCGDQLLHRDVTIPRIKTENL